MAIGHFVLFRIWTQFVGPLQTKYEIPNIIPVQARPVSQMDCLSSPKAWSLEKNLWKFQISRSLLLYFRFGLSFSYSDLVDGRTNSKVSGTFIEVCCVPSATCESKLYQSQYRVQSIVVFVSLFLTLFYAPCVCSVYSSNPRAMFASILSFKYKN